MAKAEKIETRTERVTLNLSLGEALAVHAVLGSVVGVGELGGHTSAVWQALRAAGVDASAHRYRSQLTGRLRVNGTRPPF